MKPPASVILASTLLWLVACLYWLPSHIAEALGWSAPAVEYVVGRIELGCLWLAVAFFLALRRWSRPSAPIALWAASEALLGAAARLALPMCCAPADRKTPLAVQAWGAAGEWSSLVMASLAVWWVAVLLSEQNAQGVQGGWWSKR